MIYTSTYQSPIGNLLIASKDNKLVGLWMEYYLSNFKEEIVEMENLEILERTKKWLEKVYGKF